jgi:SM-20-related protein
VTHAATAVSRYGRIVEAIAERGICVEPAFLASRDIAALAADARRRDAAGELRASAIGRGTSRIESPGVRGDRIAWLDADDPTSALRRARVALAALRRELNAALYLGLEELEMHYALYPPGAAYARHRDRFRNDDARVVSCVIYLNDAWQASDGGALRVSLNDGETLDVLPVGGTFVAFLSATFHHEVLPAHRERLSLTGWFRRCAT